jgi:hypothetical protein
MSEPAKSLYGILNEDDGKISGILGDTAAECASGSRRDHGLDKVVTVNALTDNSNEHRSLTRLTRVGTNRIDFYFTVTENLAAAKRRDFFYGRYIISKSNLHFR